MMKKAIFRKYKSSDFMRVRDFLIRNYLAFDPPVNWDVVRWNYARYFAAPMLGAWGIGNVAATIPDISSNAASRAVKLWESVIGIWETVRGEIAGVVCPDEYVPWHPAFGQAFLQRDPRHEYLLPEMLSYAEQTLSHSAKARITIGSRDISLIRIVQERGYQKDEKPCMHMMQYDLQKLPPSRLPEGYRFMSMAETDDLEKRRKVFGLSFRHPNPNEWPTRTSYSSLQTAPDYRKDLDLVVVRPDGEFVACTIAWYDADNRLATLEPLGSIQLGMGREVAIEALQRTAALGAKIAYMDSGLKFYLKIGFQKTFPIYRWIKRL
ncbi:hypothetical protein JW979_12055 [bacterium]|nr:hypothetical protein [candidate division CSSED10-310 bacterium]